MDEDFIESRADFMYTVCLNYIKNISLQLSSNIIVDDSMLKLIKSLSLSARDQAYKDSVKAINDSRDLSKKEYFETYGKKIDDMTVELDAALVTASSSQALIEAWTTFDNWLSIMELPE